MMLAFGPLQRQNASMVNQAGVEEPDGRARGGIERAKRLTPEARSRIAKDAALARWAQDVSEAVCGSPDQPLRIGEAEIECYVLDEGTRVVTQRSFLQALGRHPKANVRRESNEEQLPAILQGRKLRKHISQDTIEKSRPITFRPPGGGRANGYNALLLPAVCEVYLAARQAGDLDRQQEHVAQQAELLIRGLATVGIIALVDEATGYQDIRAKNALARILEEFIDKELQPWLQTFPDDFYRELFRLRGLDFPNSRVRRPQYFGHLTNDIVYKRLAPGVLDELRRVTPKSESGRRKHKYFQRLTSNVGYPRLREHLGSVVTLMKLSTDWSDFATKLDRFHPRVGDQMVLMFDDDDDGTGL
jgi:P63C domain